ncbi:MAG TPA: hypothetical protein PLB35_00820 [Myxococcota bacterium]|jgi:hypothetical protein|nr:hypothetical protein [Myxococcota bacterium]HOA12471.1 hypothetical protein [Myxococcota bacterium]HOH75776.1 hypothetical protein [Myxococcota bacterium]HPV03278.1 hypothetical protein [Myxococcota bacterium]
MKKLPFRPVAPTVLLVMLIAWGCGYKREIMPLVGEDDKALEFSGQSRWYLDKSAASMAFEEFARAVQAGDAEGCVAALGPMTLALLNGQAAAKGMDAVRYWRTGDISMIVLPGTGKPVSMLKNQFKVSEIGRFNPSRKEATLLTLIEGVGESRIKAVFNGDAWVFEFIDSMPQAPAMPPVPTP